MLYFYVLIFIIVFPGQVLGRDYTSNINVFSEAGCWREIFQSDVNAIDFIDKDYEKKIILKVLIFFSTLKSKRHIPDQFFVFIDRNPDKQIAFVGIFESSRYKIHKIGVDKISTGNNKRAGYWLTPIGIYANSLEFVGWRAEGTKNSKGWMGLGRKGSRIWDFGWQVTEKKPNSKLDERKIRLLLHSTDPFDGEKKLGSAASQGCIRISSQLNNFLDHYGIIDSEYEKNRNKKRISWLLKKDRQVSPLAGKYVIVEDSKLF